MLTRKMNAWAVVLAGGDGTRLQPLTRLISGDSRPKQFCPIFGERTLLGETRARLAPLFPAERTLFVVQDAHRSFCREEFADVDPRLVLSQPSNKGTGVAIAYALSHLAAREPDAVVAFFPADHHYDDEAKFLEGVRGAMEVAAGDDPLLTLIGMPADAPEVEYGWIEPESNQGEYARVRRFWEKPSAELARELQERGCLWNTFVMMGTAAAFEERMRASTPELLAGAQWMVRQGGLSRPRARRMFSVLPPVDFSQRVLSRDPEKLLVFPLHGVKWSDLGKPERVIETLAARGIRPRWAPQGFIKKATA